MRGRLLMVASASAYIGAGPFTETGVLSWRPYSIKYYIVVEEVCNPLKRRENKRLVFGVFWDGRQSLDRSNQVVLSIELLAHKVDRGDPIIGAVLNEMIVRHAAKVSGFAQCQKFFIREHVSGLRKSIRSDSRVSTRQ